MWEHGSIGRPAPAKERAIVVDMAIPEHVKQNLATIQTDLMRNWQSIVSAQPASGRGFDQFLSHAVDQAHHLMAAPMAPAGPAFMPIAAPPPDEGPSAGFQAFMAGLSTGEANLYGRAQQTAAVAAPELLPGFRSYQEQTLRQLPTGIDDRSFYNGQAMTPEQIDRFLREKNSPFAEQRFEGGKTAGQLIWEVCQQTGDPKTGGPHQVNPAMLLAIMGAETSFGRDGTWSKTNPFSIRLQGSFDRVRDFPTSLRIAANTMYNWAQARPADSPVSLFDFAGSHYCEDYQETWKPNVEKFFQQALGSAGERLA